MHTRFHVRSTIADITDFEFHMHGYLVEGSLAPGMMVRIRPRDRIQPDYRLDRVEEQEWFTKIEGKSYYNLVIQCGDLATTEMLYDLRMRDEDIEIHALPE